MDLDTGRWMTGPQGAHWLAEVLPNASPLAARKHLRRKGLSDARSLAVVQQVDLRVRAKQKFPLAERMFFTAQGLQQATDAWCARYKAERFAAAPEVVDACCGIGGDLIALARVTSATGVDRDPLCCWFAQANTRAHDVRATVQSHPISGGRLPAGAWLHIDPDRRATGRRTVSVDRFSPARDEIESCLTACRSAAVKLAPATVAPETWLPRCELEWIGRQRECKQQVAWFGETTCQAGRRCATVLDAQGAVVAQIRNDTASSPGPRATSLPDAFIYEPHAAVIAARLVDSLALELDLARLSPHVAYLTGPASAQHPALQAFEVMEQLPMRPKRIAEALVSQGVGHLEVKRRGVEPPWLPRVASSHRGTGESATLILTRVADGYAALLCRRTTQAFGSPSGDQTTGISSSNRLS